MNSGVLRQWVSTVLQVGTGISAAIIGVGVLFGSPGITLAGMFVLTLTPAVELGAAATAFVQRRGASLRADRRGGMRAPAWCPHDRHCAGARSGWVS